MFKPLCLPEPAQDALASVKKMKKDDTTAEDQTDKELTRSQKRRQLRKAKLRERKKRGD